jgi:hypothetical protein
VLSGSEALSDRLHARVRDFGLASLSPSGVARESFEQLALDVARYQAVHNPVLQRRQRATLAVLADWRDVPAVPADAFRMGRVACHAPASDQARFHTSGTTASPGIHVFRTLETYRVLSLAWGRRALCAEPAARLTVVALAQPFEPSRHSSLGYMMQQFMRELDGRALVRGAAFDADEPGRWLLGPQGVERAGLERAVAVANERGEPVLLLATSFALAWLLEALGPATCPLPAGSRVMHTGGFKGRVSELDGPRLALEVSRALGVSAADIVGEYGMTELSSQLYDAGSDPRAPSPFRAPPWLRVTPVDPISLQPVRPGEVGLAEFTDLANVDSSLKVLTRDLVQSTDAGVVLFGRQPGSPLRGCSLAVEALRT